MADYNHENTPNAGKFMNSLRSSGYSNKAALADLVDNSLDAEASNVWVDIEKKGDDFEIRVADDGAGMDKDNLDQAMRLGSLTEKEAGTDLGKYGFGLITASISIARSLEVYTKTDAGDVLYASQDLDLMAKENRFVSTLKDSHETSAIEKNVFRSRVPAKKGTLVILQKSDRLGNKSNLSQLSDTLRKHFGQAFRHFLWAGKKIYVNGKKVEPIDPLMQEDKGTQVLLDDTVDAKVGEVRGQLRVKVAVLPEYEQKLAERLKINQNNQGFYILRNQREIASGETFGLFTKHNVLNRLRIELSYTATLDDEMGLDFAKHKADPSQALLDIIGRETQGHIQTFRKMQSRQSATSEGEKVDHSDAERGIAANAKLLITPPATIEKRNPRKHTDTRKPSDGEGAPRQNLQKVHTSPQGMGAQFLHVQNGPGAPLYDCFKEGKTITIEWNIDHPFFQRMMAGFSDRKEVTTPIDYLVYSLAAAELQQTNEEAQEVVARVKEVMSLNLRTLLA